MRARAARVLAGSARRVAVWVVVALAIAMAWALIVDVATISDYLLPTPAQVWTAVVSSPAGFLAHVAITTREILLGLAIAIVGALAWAIPLVSSSRVRRVAYPLIVAAQSAPKEALAPVFIIWWGFSSLPKIVMAALISFFPMLLATMVGLQRFSEQQRLLAASVGASTTRTLFSFRVWAALPSFLSGIRLGVTLAAIGAVLGEFLGSDEGIGYLILSASRRLDGGLMYASIITLVIISWLLVAIVDLVEASLLRGVRRGRYVT